MNKLEGMEGLIGKPRSALPVSNSNCRQHLELTGQGRGLCSFKGARTFMKLARAIFILILAIAALMQPGSSDLFAGNELPEERPPKDAPLRVVIDFFWFDDLAESERANEAAEAEARRQPESAERQFELGLMYFKCEINENWPKGVEAFKAAIKIKPDYAEAYCKLGEAYDLIHRFSLEYAHPREEREAFEKAIQIRNDCAEAYVELGRHILIDDGGTNSRRAEEFFKQAIAFAPDYVEAYDGLEQAYYDQDRKEDAWKVSAQALLVNPNRSESYYSLYGCCEADARDKIEVFNEAIRLRPNNVPAYRCLGMIYRDLGRYEEAIQAYRTLLRIAPRYDEAYYELGSIFLAIGDRQSALDQYHSLVRLIHRTAGSRRNYHYQRRALELLNEIETGKIEFSHYGSCTG